MGSQDCGIGFPGLGWTAEHVPSPGVPSRISEGVCSDSPQLLRYPPGLEALA